MVDKIPTIDSDLTPKFYKADDNGNFHSIIIKLDKAISVIQLHIQQKFELRGSRRSGMTALQNVVSCLKIEIS